MNQETAKVGFIGAGGIARSHAYSLNSLKYYYNDSPEIELAAVCSANPASRESFAKRFGFSKACSLNELLSDKDINTVFIPGPSRVHYEHLKAVLGMKGISFPSGHVPPGWLRAIVHAHYVFLTGGVSELFIPGIEQGLEVQRLVRETAEHLEKFRSNNNLC